MAATRRSGRLRARRDGKLLTLTESLPVLGFAVSAGHGVAAALTGDTEDKERARRAAAACTSSTLAMACTAAGGALGRHFSYQRSRESLHHCTSF